MNLTLKRYDLKPTRTFGELLQGGRRLCYVLEDAVRQVNGRPVSEWKVPGQTAIPTGLYRVTLENSPRFGPDTLTVNGVPGFVGIRIHAGNTEADTEGCPLLGLQVNASGIVGGTSRQAVATVKELVRQAIAAGEPVMLEVVNP